MKQMKQIVKGRKRPVMRYWNRGRTVYFSRGTAIELSRWMFRWTSEEKMMVSTLFSAIRKRLGIYKRGPLELGRPYDVYFRSAA